MTELTVTIREIQPEELDATVKLRHDMIMEIDGLDYDQVAPGWRERFKTFFAGYLQSNRGQFFVAEDGDQLIGTAAVYKLSNHRSEITLRASAYVCNVYVNPKWRRQGIARALTLRAVDWAKGNGCEVVRLRTSHLGRPLYEGIGFQRTDELELRL
ncbi:MAG TPA: GNAT family N-acetyltransferase [Candidatus Eremiobacteraceae bacterium]|nr:GNAT family N-acetyltransferase [Candidatus Eremiobacteraceae bacterium]